MWIRSCNSGLLNLGGTDRQTVPCSCPLWWLSWQAVATIATWWRFTATHAWRFLRCLTNDVRVYSIPGIEGPLLSAHSVEGKTRMREGKTVRFRRKSTVRVVRPWFKFCSPYLGFWTNDNLCELVSYLKCGRDPQHLLIRPL